MTQQEVPDAFDNVPPYDKRKGEHYWVVVACFFVAEPTEDLVMNVDTLVSITPSGCHYCCLPDNSWNRARRCPGKPPIQIRA